MHEGKRGEGIRKKERSKEKAGGPPESKEEKMKISLILVWCFLGQRVRYDVVSRKSTLNCKLSNN